MIVVSFAKLQKVSHTRHATPYFFYETRPYSTFTSVQTPHARTRVRYFIGKMSTLCTFCMHCADNQAFQECRQTRFLSTLLSTHCHYHITLCLHLSAPYPLCYVLIVRRRPNNYGR